jgi:hypothetical protein
MFKCLMAVFVALSSVLLSSCGDLGKPKYAEEKMKEENGNYTKAPVLANCDAGKLSEAAKQSAVAVLTEMRALHGLPPALFDVASEADAMASALMFAVNGDSSHYPPANWKCYSANGALTASKSNISGSVGARYENIQDDLTSYLSDINNFIKGSVGHRRWLLDPFLFKFSYGRVVTAVNSEDLAQGSAVKVIYDEASKPATTFSSDLIAYPFHDYPAKFFPKGAILSMSLMIDSTSFWANDKVDFSAAQILLSKRAGGTTPVRDVKFDNTAYGLPNNLQFMADIEHNVIYDVVVRNVKANGVAREINYWFRIKP